MRGSLTHPIQISSAHITYIDDPSLHVPCPHIHCMFSQKMTLGMKSFTNTIGLVRFSCCETMQREGCRVSTQLHRKVCLVRKMIFSVSPPVQSSDCKQPIQFHVSFTSRYSSQAPLGHSYPSLSPAAVSLRREGNTEMLALNMHCVADKHIHSLVPRPATVS